MAADQGDLATGEPITEGEGQVVVTVLREDYPLVRFGTGDLSAWVRGSDGRPRLAGVLGRVGEAVKVRGMFLHPRQAAAVMTGIEGVQDWRFVIERVDHRDELRCEVVTAELEEHAYGDAYGDADTQALTEHIRAVIRAGLRLGVAVRVVPALPVGHPAITDNRTWS